MKRTLILIGLVLSISEGLPCGLSWTLPHTKFEGVDERGHVFLAGALGEANFGQGLKLPVFYEFNSSFENSSPYFGKGWTIPFLESHIEPIDETSIKVIMPDGWLYYFGRKDPSSQDYFGNRGWMGHLDKDTFSAWAPCGWEIKFSHGKIESITTPQNQEIAYTYEDGVVSRVSVQGTDGLLVQYDPITKQIDDIKLGSSSVGIELASQPRIEMVSNKLQVTGAYPSLSLLHFPDNTLLKYTFSLLQSPIIPTLTVTDASKTPETITWDPQTKLILTDGDWTYHLKPGNGSDSIPIDRVNSKGQSEYYFVDNSSGITTEKNLDGVETQTYRFVNARDVTGQIRKITKEEHGVTSVVYQAAYDEKGRLLTDSSQTLLRHSSVWDDVTHTAIITYYDTSGRISFTYHITSTGRILSITDKDGHLIKPDNITHNIPHL